MEPSSPRTVAATQLHRRISPDKWCVTYADLCHLRDEVKEAIHRGEITLHEGRPSELGPSFYVINDQYVKPVTFVAGKMSWALMRNRNGLECHIFISHAWIEGVFEFIVKVLYSWPQGAQSAWMCTLSMPQHLDIKDLIKVPRTSPFAIALNAASHVLVVPNHHKSIYTRLWCAYEIYLADECGKVIVIARASRWKQTRRNLIFISAAIPLGVAAGMLARARGMMLNNSGPALAIAAGACTLLWPWPASRIRLAGNFVGIIALSCMAVAWKTHVWYWQEDIPIVFLSMVQRAVFVFNVFFFFISEVDRVRSIQKISEAEQLSRGFQGSITCSEVSYKPDGDMIWEDIGDKVEDADRAIHVLMAAGVSTYSLGQASLKGVDITSAGHAEIALPFGNLGPFLLVAIGDFLLAALFDPSQSVYLIVMAISILSRVALVIIVLRTEQLDERCFLLKVVSKWGFLNLVLAFLVMVSRLLWPEFGDKAVTVLHVMNHSSYFLMLILGLLGIRGVAATPCGLTLLSIFLPFGCPRCRRPRRARPVKSEEEGEDAALGDISTATKQHSSEGSENACDDDDDVIEF